MKFLCGVSIVLFSFCSLFNDSSILIENLKIDLAKNAWVSDENDPGLFRQIALNKDNYIPNLLESGKLGEAPLSDTQKDICTEMAVAISVIRESIYDVLNCPLIGSRAKELIANLWFNVRYLYLPSNILNQDGRDFLISYLTQDLKTLIIPNINFLSGYGLWDIGASFGTVSNDFSDSHKKIGIVKLSEFFIKSFDLSKREEQLALKAAIIHECAHVIYEDPLNVDKRIVDTDLYFRGLLKSSDFDHFSFDYQMFKDVAIPVVFDDQGAIVTRASEPGQEPRYWPKAEFDSLLKKN